MKRIYRQAKAPGSSWFEPPKTASKVRPKSVPCPVCHVGIGEGCVTVGNTGWSHNQSLTVEVGKPYSGSSVHQPRRVIAIRKMNEGDL